jgi:hypothetical protein
MPSPLEEALWQQIVAAELPWPQREVRFAKPRRWRWDFAWEHLRLAVEVQGGRWCGNRSTHNGGARQTRSFEKVNQAALLGWRCFYVNQEMIENGTAIALIRRAIERDEENPDDA